jgi:PhzF family phenazine biosynthesis protein
VPVRVRDGKATLTSAVPYVEAVADQDVDEALALLRWSREELDPALPPRIAYAGVRHLVLAAATRERLARLDYDYEGLRAYMLRRELTTVDLIWRETPELFHARDPFPVGDTVEDPATGAAAAALGAYLRELGLVAAPAELVVLQGEDMGRPSRMEVTIAPDRPEIEVSGGAVVMP